MRSYELDEQDPLSEKDFTCESVLVPADVENDPSPFEDARISILGFDLGWIPPRGMLCLEIPGFQLLDAVWVPLPERLQPAPRDHPHRRIVYNVPIDLSNESSQK